MAATLEQVKNALGVTGNYQDDTIKVYFDEVVAFLKDAGIAESKITPGVVARGVTDLWNYGGTEGKFSPAFLQRAAQLSYKQ